MATFSVTNTNDSGAGSLRQAIIDANAAGGADTIEFQAGLGTITLTSAALDKITSDITLNGNGNLLDGGSTYRGLLVESGTVYVNNLTIQNMRDTGGLGEAGENGGGAPGGGGAGMGGALFVQNGADVTISDLTLRNNSATGGNGNGYGGNGRGGNGGDSAIGNGGTGGGANENGANGGFGGGGGGAGFFLLNTTGGNGGFGGGGGGSGGAGAGTGGFGGGDGSNAQSDFFSGGGLGAGGGLFVQEGGVLTLSGSLTIDDNSVAGGSSGGGSAEAGSAFGSGLFLQGDGTVTFNPGSGKTQTVNDVIADQTGSGGTGANAGSWNLVKSGSGTLTLSGTNTYSGTTTVSAGTLSVDGALNGGGTLTVASGATLAGSGSTTGAVIISTGGSFTPGNSPGQISTGDLTLSTGSTSTFEINGTTAGTSHDQIDVTGSVDVSGATLATSFGFTSANGNSFTLILNDGSDAVTGIFSGLAEGATFGASGRTYSISYAAGDGNDVAITDVTQVPASDSGDGSDAVFGSSGADQLDGSSSGETISGGGGDDIVRGAGGNDILYGGTGSDLLYGNLGGDQLRGGDGEDTIFGGQGSDTLSGGADADNLCGNTGTDILYGNAGSDILYGNQGNDTLYGGQDDDTIYGGQGDDILAGNIGNDTLYGNLGSDLFVFSEGGGSDVIADYSMAEGDSVQFALGTDIDTAVTDAGVVLSTGSFTVTLTGISAIADVDILFQ